MPPVQRENAMGGKAAFCFMFSHFFTAVANIWVLTLEMSVWLSSRWVQHWKSSAMMPRNGERCTDSIFEENCSLQPCWEFYFLNAISILWEFHALSGDFLSKHFPTNLDYWADAYVPFFNESLWWKLGSLGMCHFYMQLLNEKKSINISELKAITNE